MRHLFFNYSSNSYIGGCTNTIQLSDSSRNKKEDILQHCGDMSYNIFACSIDYKNAFAKV